ncbi:wall-associated receptor kinase 4-like [Triticum dicoccoides]|uniref:wall-associated receptor kinase 4-like n=1 Tax=Triticum dicoccoides TaxID=85692 RepID=UPI0018912873|nr:wall-associated receptor kinase 4-like [Triticum dicoccoides]
MSTTFLLPTLLLAALAATATSLTLKPGCRPSCGGVDVPYPFGIGQGCFLPGFEIVCDNSRPILGNTEQAIEVFVLSLSVTPRPEARVMVPITWQCFNSSGDAIKWSISTVNYNRAGVYRISNNHNELVVLGCNTLVYTNGGPRGRSTYTYYTGCAAYCDNAQSARDGDCTGVGCCHVDIPPGLSDNKMRFSGDPDWKNPGMPFSLCDYAFIVEKGNYTFQKADLKMDLETSKPLRLDWAIRVNNGSSLSCAEAPSMPGYMCVSQHSECVDSTNGPGYVCNCTEGYEGNPYLHKGCTSIGLGVSILVFALLLAFIMHQKRKLAEHFEMNGGNILKSVIGLPIFTEKDLKKITKNNSECLGNGYFGKVYKGTLPDEAIVAVKSFIKVDKDRIGEFTEEVKIQLKMKHPNILKLMGCCLQLDVPMLVYEFAAEGSLRDILHWKQNQKLSAELRLDIAIGSANGLSYMHSEDIRHGDVKPDNILLSDKSIPKIADFGLSKLLNPGEKFTKKVIGCQGYMDPVFRNTGILTSKSDVYSFGVVLLELISRKKVEYGESGSLIIEFRHIYETKKSGRSLFDEEIVAEKDILILEEIGKLAMQCLKERLDGRPGMKEVAEQLVKIKENIVHTTATTLR